MRHRRILPIFFVIVGLVALACTSATNSDDNAAGSSVPAAAAFSEGATTGEAEPPEDASKSEEPTDSQEQTAQSAAEPDAPKQTAQSLEPAEPGSRRRCRAPEREGASSEKSTRIDVTPQLRT